jgi:hypothetical protein
MKTASGRACQRGQSAANEPGVGADWREQQPGSRGKEQRGPYGQLPHQLPVDWPVLEGLVPERSGTSLTRFWPLGSARVKMVMASVTEAGTLSGLITERRVSPWGQGR